MAAAAIAKIAKIAISSLRCNWSLQNLIRWCKMAFLTAPTVKAFEFQKSKHGGHPPFWIPLNRHILTDFDEIWHSDAHWPLTAVRPLKFRIFENPRCRRPPSWKSQKSRYLRNGLTDLYEIWYRDAKWGCKPPRPLNIWISQIRTATILKTVKLQYFCKCSSVFDEIWHGDAY